MCSYTLKIKWCPVCDQGWVEIVKEKKTQQLFLCCSECETEWTDPQNINPKNGTHDYFGEIDIPSIDEIHKKKWSCFIFK